MHGREMLEGQGGRHEDGGRERGERPPRRAPADVNCEAISRGGLPMLSQPAVAFAHPRCALATRPAHSRLLVVLHDDPPRPPPRPPRPVAPPHTHAPPPRPAPRRSTFSLAARGQRASTHAAAPSSSPESSRRLITHACPHPSLSSALSPQLPTAHHVRRYEIREPPVPTPKARARRQQCLPGVEQRGGHSAPSRAVQTLWLRTPAAPQPLRAFSFVGVVLQSVSPRHRRSAPSTLNHRHPFLPSVEPLQWHALLSIKQQFTRRRVYPSAQHSGTNWPG